jgi:hypothetical protein
MGTPRTSEVYTRPALAGYCGVVGCDNVADLETVSRRGEFTYVCSKTCLDHASTGQLQAMEDAR